MGRTVLFAMRTVAEPMVVRGTAAETSIPGYGDGAGITDEGFRGRGRTNRAEKAADSIQPGTLRHRNE
jgi:hypothetical protein